MVEVLNRLLLSEISEGKLPPYWNDSPGVQGLYKSVENTFQAYINTVHAWVNGTTLSNAIGKNLDDIGYLWNVKRLLRTDDQYRQAILSVILASTDSGTPTDVKRLIRSITSTPLIRTTSYPKTRYTSFRIENAFATKSTRNEIDKAVSSGSRSQVYWEPSNVCFIPCIKKGSAGINELQAVTGSGNESILAKLGGYEDTIGIPNTLNAVFYMATPDRSYLPINIIRTGATEILEAITPSGNTAVQSTLLGGFMEDIELITDEGSLTITSGRTLALSPSN